MFLDKVIVDLKAGDGGRGIVSFSHEKYKAKGGPNGGDGGDGGNIFLKVDSNLNTLSFFATRKNIAAESGKQGGNNKKRGKSAPDLILNVACGTMVFDADSGQKIIDLTEPGQTLLIARGGKGGFGNAHFVSSRRQVPKIAELGEPGEEKKLRLELKLIAEVGLIGLPNVGKSTLLSVISSARPKIADYPFTTLIPNLGVVKGPDFEFVAADIPGLIEGAAQGKGLGTEFLRHVERTKILVHLISAESQNPAKDFSDIYHELESFSEEIVKKPQIIVISKIDLLKDNSNILKEITKITKKKNIVSKKPFLISAATHEGVNDLIYFVSQALKKIPKIAEKKEEEYKVFTLADIKGGFDIQKQDGVFVITGEKIEKFAIKTDFSNPHSVLRLYDIFKKMGIQKSLARLGAKGGDTLQIGKKMIKFRER